jgi:hypothetical protein
VSTFMVNQTHIYVLDVELYIILLGPNIGTVFLQAIFFLYFQLYNPSSSYFQVSFGQQVHIVIVHVNPYLFSFLFIC